MMLILHIVKKDLRRFWIPIVLLGLALFIKAEFLTFAPSLPTWVNQFDGRMVHPGQLVTLNSAEALEMIYQMDLGNRLRTIMLWIIAFFDYVLLIVLVLGVLLDDPTLSDRAFWRTRPIAGLQMAAAKGIFILLIGWPMQMAMQILVNFVRWPGAVHWYGSFGPLAWTQAAWISAIALAAVLWRNPVVGLASVAAIAFSYVMLLNVVITTMLSVLKPVPLRSNTVIAFDYADTLSLSLLLGMALLVAGVMYARRNRKLGFAIFGMGLVAMFVEVICLAK